LTLDDEENYIDMVFATVPNKRGLWQSVVILEYGKTKITIDMGPLVADKQWAKDITDAVMIMTGYQDL